MRNRCHWFQVQSEARIKLSPMDVEYDHLYCPSDHQVFIFREKLWICLSVLEVGNLSLFTTFKKQFGLGRWKRGPPRIEHSIHSNIPPLNISLLQFREFPLHTMCAQWWPLIRSRGIQDVQMCRTAAWRFIMIQFIHYHIRSHTYTDTSTSI
jgi:hypothetical protein